MLVPLGYKIRRVREFRNLSQQYVADKLSVSQSTYSDMENGKIAVSEEKLAIIANVLDVSVDVINEYNDQVVFNSCTQSGYINTNNINPIDKIEEVYKQILEVHEKRITDLLAVIEAKDKLIATLEKKG
jgi:transcriptional regulator with XRE-family HTH domain